MATTASASRPKSSYDIDVEDVEYLRDGETSLLARLYKPRGAGPFPLMIDLHGGAWCTGDRMNDAPISEALAKSGVVVAALDFRMPPQAAYPGSVADIHYAIRWLKSRAPQYKIRPDKVGGIGISSGGHQGMLIAMRPDDPRYAARKLAGHENIDAALQCFVNCWPVIDPLGRYQYAQKLIAGGGPRPETIDRVFPLHLKYWGSEAAMEEGNPVRMLERGEPAKLPPVLYVQGEQDMMHPRPHLDRFVAEYRKRGGEVDLALYPGEAESFVLRNASGPNAPKAMERIIAFVHRHLG
jgi:acetyl esterase/lipase